VTARKAPGETRVRNAGRAPKKPARAAAPRRPAEGGSDVAELLRRLRAAYPDAKCSLDHRNAFELAVATVLSAQCTDARVNVVTKQLFKECPDAAALDRMPLERVEALIRSTGFFRNKAKALKGLARRLLEAYGGEIPPDFSALLTLPGVARKTANVVLGSGFGIPSGVVVDTHVGRISRRLGLTRHDDPVKVEQDLVRALPEKEWIVFSHRLIEHGRSTCTALKPRCDACGLRDLCPYPATAARSAERPKRP
jgi:endonuclease III